MNYGMKPYDPTEAPIDRLTMQADQRCLSQEIAAREADLPYVSPIDRMMEESCALDPDPDRPTDPDAFCIDSDRAANWLLRKLGNIEAEKARVQAQAAAIIKALDADAERLQHLYGAQLEYYCRERIAQGRGKTVRFLQGTCSLRAVPAAVRVADMGAALHYASENLPEVVRITRTLDGRAYADRAQKELKASGALLPGVEICPARESFSVKFGKTE